MKKSKINLVPNQEGTTIRPSSNPDVHFIRLNQTSMQLNPTTNFVFINASIWNAARTSR